MIKDQEIYDVIQMTLDSNRVNLITDSIESTEHYLEHGEPEMAFEGLFFGMFLLEAPRLVRNKQEYLEIARKLKLDVEPNFRGDFYENLLLFFSRKYDKNL